MAREARLHIPYALYHVSLHSNASESLFVDKQDGLTFYKLLAEGKQKFGHDILGFCLLDDQVHLAIKIAEQPLSQIIHNLTFRYTRWFNSRHQRSGHLFAGRYKATVVQVEKYLPDLIRYLHLSPVRLNLATKPAEFIWSSHRIYLGKDKLDWLNTDLLLNMFDKSNSKARLLYQDFIREGMAHGRPKDLVAAKFTGRVFGDAVFTKTMLGYAEHEQPNKTVSLDQLITAVTTQYQISESELVSLGKQRSSSVARGVLAYLVKQTATISFTDLAKRVNRDATTLSAHASRIEKKIKQDKTFAQVVTNLRNQIF